MRMKFELSDFSAADGEALNRVALAAFAQYSGQYEDWDRFSRSLACMNTLAENAEVVVASVGGEPVGAVAYVAPGKPRAAVFAPEWALMRMLVVEPSFRGHGIGRALANECLRRAERDGAPVLALHTSSIMQAALAMYHRMGFVLEGSMPPIHGVPYAIYTRWLKSGIAGKPAAPSST